MTITVKTVDAEKWGWKKGDKLAVLLGEDGDHGMIRLKPDAKNGVVEPSFKQLKGGAFLTIALGHVDRFVDRRETTQGVNAEKLDDGWVEIVLPSWAEDSSPAAIELKQKQQALAVAKSPAGRKAMIAKAAAAYPSKNSGR